VYGTKVVTGVCFATEWSSKYPNGVAVDSSGNVYVAEYPRIFNIQKYTKNGNPILGWGSTGSNIGQFWFHDGVAVDSSGDVYVADGGNDRIQKFKLSNPCPAGTTQVNTGVCFVIEWSKKGPLNGELRKPVDVAVDSSGDVYVAESGNNRIQKFKLANPCPAGTTQVQSNPVGGVCFVTLWGALGRVSGAFSTPSGVAVDSSGNIFVADTYNHRIQKFKLANTCPAGANQILSGVCFITKWGSYGPLHGQFISPSSIDVDSSGNVYVADTGNHRVEKFTNTGTYLLTIPKPFLKVFSPEVAVTQECVMNFLGIDSYSYTIGPKKRLGANTFYFDPWTQDMAIVVDGIEVSYGKNLAIGGVAPYPPWFGLGSHTVLMFVETYGNPTYNHRLDPGELSARTTFTTKSC
jgi:DNA-binding beta-propeller fold protein YncE